jgi:hypothetical protein
VLAEEFLADIELAQLRAPQIVLKCARLAPRLRGESPRAEIVA